MKKLVEGSHELLKAKNKKSVLEELADILEILQTLTRAEKIRWNILNPVEQLRPSAESGRNDEISRSCATGQAAETFV